MCGASVSAGCGCWWAPLYVVGPEDDRPACDDFEPRVSRVTASSACDSLGMLGEYDASDPATDPDDDGSA